ncbi:MAG: DUF2750 domain-containing protein [Clostridiales bacterium]|uniref:DUF2750 domain-containing protein n=1 Tax=Clostridium sp. N3C TaxID=1776758 RepID=UPI00092E099B|nr:DUF2750 domain-containing protein [Clostridium sp. N3C]NLZ48583.1 DUF2750 domain-containing protein [Clostridiales bacterium]SCN24887.1 hypothetical protein N3C_2028 [Clostridium sp. N3C]
MDYSEVEEVFCLRADRKHIYFLTKAVETECVYGLKQNNEWITIKDSKGNLAMPIWPSYDFARYCQENQWKDTQIESVDLYEFLEYWLLGMKRDKCKVLLFADTAGGGFSIDAEQLKDEIEDLLGKIS